jgi:hypothetical protein
VRWRYFKRFRVQVFSSSVTANGVNATTGLLQSQNGFAQATILYHLGYLVLLLLVMTTTTSRIFQRRWFIAISYKWVSRLTLNSTGATFASSVTANGLLYNSIITSNGTPLLTYNAPTRL